MDSSSAHSGRWRAWMHLFGVFLLTFVAGTFVSTGVSAEASAASRVEAQDADVPTVSDGCEDECPGELPDGECADDCQHCGCCGVGASSLPPAAVDLTSALVSSRASLPPLPSFVPTGVADGIFKPPRHDSVYPKA